MGVIAYEVQNYCDIGLGSSAFMGDFALQPLIKNTGVNPSDRRRVKNTAYSLMGDTGEWCLPRDRKTLQRSEINHHKALPSVKI